MRKLEIKAGHSLYINTGDNKLTANQPPTKGPAEVKWKKASSLNAALLNNLEHTSSIFEKIV